MISNVVHVFKATELHTLKWLRWQTLHCNVFCYQKRETCTQGDLWLESLRTSMNRSRAPLFSCSIMVFPLISWVTPPIPKAWWSLSMVFLLLSSRWVSEWLKLQDPIFPYRYWLNFETYLVERSQMDTLNTSFLTALVKSINTSVSEDLYFSLTPSQVKTPPSPLVGSGPTFLRHIFLRESWSVLGVHQQLSFPSHTG